MTIDLLEVRREEATFAGAAGLLFRRSVRPASVSATRARLALVHGYGDHSGRYGPLFDHLAARGVACHALDLRGQGRSAGRRGFVRRWDDYLDDLSRFLQTADLADGSPAPLFLMGHSHGALVATAWCMRADVTNVAGLILSAPFFVSALRVPAYLTAVARVLNPLLPWMRFATGMRGEWLCSDPAMLRETASDPYAARVATPRWYLSHPRVQRDVLARAAEFRLPLLVLHGRDDPVADPAGGGFFERAGSSDKTQHLYPGLRHEILRESIRESIFAEIFQWISRRSPPPDGAAPHPHF